MIMLGTRITARARFAPAGADVTDDAALEDPDLVTFTVERPDTTEITYTSGDLEVEHPATGQFDLSLLPNQAGTWWVRAVGSGSGPNVAVEQSFIVAESSLVP